MSSRLAQMLLAGAAITAMAVSVPAVAQEWQTKPVRFITPFRVGGGPEAFVRVLAEKLLRKWGQPVLVEN